MTKGVFMSSSNSYVETLTCHMVAFLDSVVKEPSLTEGIRWGAQMDRISVFMRRDAESSHSLCMYTPRKGHLRTQ